MQYNIACSEIEENYEQTVIAATSHYGKKMAKIASEAKTNLGSLFQEVVTKMMNERAGLVQELKKEEACINDQAQKYREEALVTHTSACQIGREWKEDNRNVTGG